MSSNPHAPTVISSLLGSGGTALAGPTGRIGAYRLLSVLGEGGFGIVYLAEQTEPVRRRVALKIIKLGMDTAQVVARFEAERQALALMDHPGVAKVLDAGSTEAGRPYFVMEYVPGEPLLSYCDKARLATRERVELFVQVTEAVQHAHHKGIVHRDLKPTNVLVELVDARSLAKVIDFGISKAINQPLTERTIFTEAGQMVGTPEYMSPEQAEMSGLNVDTRTDIYALGVMLYEALAGVLPFESDRLRSVGLDEVHRIIREEDPPRPSTRIRSHASREEVARHRRTEAASLERQVRGDLDRIVMKAMEKDRSRRYASASEFGEDLRRYLRDEPVLAAPASMAYIARKFVRRHRSLVGAGAVAGIAVAAGVAAVGWSAYASARSERMLQRSLDGFLAAQELLTEPMERVRPEMARGRDPTLGEYVRLARASVPSRARDPIALAAMRDTIGTTFLALGELDEAEALLREALAAREASLGPTHPQTLASRHRWASLLDYRGRHDEARPMLEAIVRDRERRLGPDHRDTLNSRDLLGAVIHHQAMVVEHQPSGTEPPEDRRLRLLGEARLMHVETLAARARAFGADDPDTLDSRTNLAAVLWSMGSTSEAREEVRRVYESRLAAWGEFHPKAISAEHNLGVLEWSDAIGGRADDPRLGDAIEHLRRAASGFERVLGPVHQTTIGARVRLGEMLADERSAWRDLGGSARVLEGALADCDAAGVSPLDGPRVTALCAAAKTWAARGEVERAIDELNVARSTLDTGGSDMEALVTGTIDAIRARAKNEGRP